MTAMEIWLLERAEPLYKLYPWKALLRLVQEGVQRRNMVRSLCER